MTKNEKIALMQNRIKTLESTNKNVKCPGVLRALRREVRNLQNED